MQSCFHRSTLQSRNARLSHLFRHMLHPSWQLVSILGEIYECLDKNWDRNMLFANHFLTWCILNFKKLLPSSEFLLPSWKPWRKVSTTFVHSSRNQSSFWDPSFILKIMELAPKAGFINNWTNKNTLRCVVRSEMFVVTFFPPTPEYDWSLGLVTSHLHWSPIVGFLQPTIC